MPYKEKQKRKLTRKWLHKYRLVILNEDTFEEKLSLKLTRLSVFVVVTLSAILLVMGTIFIIAFSPLKEYIPGYSSSALKREATELAFKTDSLQNVLKLNTQYLNSIRSVLSGEVESGSISWDSVMQSPTPPEELEEIGPSKADSLLREEVAQEDKYNILASATAEADFSLFPPVKGSISAAFEEKERHYAVDVVVPRNAPVKSVADGRVVFSEWTAETGYVIIIRHNYGLLSVYKHNAKLTKEQGDLVRAGEVVATAGSTGEYTTGPHLHFELWNEGVPVNPVDYIDFD